MSGNPSYQALTELAQASGVMIWPPTHRRERLTAFKQPILSSRDGCNNMTPVDQGEQRWMQATQ
jgi:hypothetical protein